MVRMISHKRPEYLLVKRQADLRQISNDLKREVAVGVDLEADSMFHYREKVCLLQISTTAQNILVDPLALEDLSPLAPVFADPCVQKVFHGADYDIRSLHRDFNIEVNSLFDTQIAARFLGHKETGLASLLKERLSVHMEKKYQKRDWSERPLREAMCAYAVQDTCHLLPLARILGEELRNKGLLFCVEEECEVLSKVRVSPSDDNPLFLSFKGGGRLDRQSLAVLEAILRLRDDLARRRDRPPFKVLGNTQIMEIAKKKPLTESELNAIGELSPSQIKVLGRSILKSIHEAINLPEDALPLYPRKGKQPIGHKVAARIKALKQWRKRRSSELGIDPVLVCNNSQIQSLALSYPKDQRGFERVNGIRKWQRLFFGREICALLKTTG